MTTEARLGLIEARLDAIEAKMADGSQEARELRAFLARNGAKGGSVKSEAKRNAALAREAKKRGQYV